MTQVTDSLPETHAQLLRLEQLLTKTKGQDRKLHREYLSQYIPIALKLNKYEKAVLTFSNSRRSFRSLRAAKAFLDLGSLIEPHLYEVTNTSLVSKFYLAMAYANRTLRQKEKQIDYFSKALAIIQSKNQDSLLTAEVLSMRGQSYAWSGKFLPALNDLRLAIDYYKALGKPYRSLQIENMLLLLLTRNGFGDEAVVRRLKLIEDFKKTGPKVVAPLQYLNLASDYQAAGDLKNYEKYLLKSVELAKEKASTSNNNYLFVTAYALLSELYLEKDLAKAKSYLDLSKKNIKREFETSVYHILIYQINSAKYLMSTKRYDEAASILKTLIDQNRIKEPKQLTEVYELLGNIYETKNAHSEALKYYVRFQKLKDSVFSIRKVNMLSYYQTRYETEKKEKEITNQELAIQSQRTTISTKERQQTFFLVGLMTLILLLIGLFFFIKKIRAEKRKVADALIEKELLLKEIHHRVKNNLQIVHGLMYKQARNSKDYTFKSLMEDAQGRIKSMAMIHQKLYQNNNFREVDMKGYISELIKDINASFSTKSMDIGVTLQIAASKFHMDTAIPLGLIFNELITNIYKHAFHDGKGNILISIEKTDGRYRIKVKDDGVGMSEGIDLKKTTSLGMNLITGLCHQIRATFNHKNDNGSEFTILLHSNS